LKTRGRTKHARRNFYNCFGVIKLGLRLLKDGPYQAIRVDKDGGFALVAKNQVLPEMLQILSNPQRYCEVSRPLDFCVSVVRGFVDVVCYNLPGHLGEEEKLFFLRSVLRSVKGRVKNVVSRLKCTIKTHKGTDKVS